MLTLKKPDDLQKEAIDFYEEMIDDIKSKIGYLLISFTSLKKDALKQIQLMRC